VTDLRAIEDHEPSDAGDDSRPDVPYPPPLPAFRFLLIYLIHPLAASRGKVDGRQRIVTQPKHSQGSESLIEEVDRGPAVDGVACESKRLELRREKADGIRLAACDR
jgi:hypothetical protein